MRFSCNMPYEEFDYDLKSNTISVYLAKTGKVKPLEVNFEFLMETTVQKY